MNSQKELTNLLQDFCNVLLEKGSSTPEVISPADAKEIESLNNLENVTVPTSLKEFYENFGGYDDDKADELDLYEPHFAWGMHIIPIEFVAMHYDNSAGCGGEENPDYWPLGFVPILAAGSGSYVVINCIEDSPTYGAIYDMSDGVGCNLISRTLFDFITASIKELKEELRVFSEPDFSQPTNMQTYLESGAKIFGSTPFFARVDNMNQQIVDWH